MSAEATGWVWKRSPHTGATLLVHLAIADVVNDANEWECWLTVEAIATKARVGRSSTVTALATLVDARLLEVTERGGGRGRPTRYTFLMPKETSRISAGSRHAKPASKPRDLSAETARSDAHIGRTERTEGTEGEPFDSQMVWREADPNCVQCQGRGTKGYAPADDPKIEPAKPIPCDCTFPDYEPRSEKTPPPPDFGMPANRGATG